MSNPKKLHRGDDVYLNIAGRSVHARVIEDRGPIGVGGRQLVRVRADGPSEDEPFTVEVPASDLAVYSR